MRWRINIGARQTLASLAEKSASSSHQVRAGSSKDGSGATPTAGGPGRVLWLSAAATLALVVVEAPPARADVPRVGQEVVNTIYVTTSEEPVPATSQATVTIAAPTPALIQWFLYAPDAPAHLMYSVVRGEHRSGPDDGSPYVATALPHVTGADAPIDLAAPVPLAEMKQLHQGDPAFLLLTDKDQNRFPDLRETVIVDIGIDLTTDKERIRLTEVSPDSGVFAGYIPTASSPTALPYNGRLEVIERSTARARYRDRYDATDVSADAVLVDPFGIFFDSRTGTPVDGVRITVVDAATGAPAQVFGDDGFSAYPSTLVSGSGTRDAAGRTYDFRAGEYRFPFMAPGVYRFVMQPPSGYQLPSVIRDVELQRLPGAPFALIPASRGGEFTIEAGPALRIDIPIDLTAVDLEVTKVADRATVQIGEFVAYDIVISNRSADVPATDVKVTDSLPVGFRYRRGTGRLDGQRLAEPVIAKDGRTLTFSIGDLPPSRSKTLRLVAQVVPGVVLGEQAVNTARAASAAGGTSSVGRAVVKVQDDPMATRTIIMGRVTTGECDAADGVGALGVPNARVYLEDGTLVVSDPKGLFHFDNVAAGAHVVQLDVESLPPGSKVVPCTVNSRFAGRAFSQFVDLQGGTMWRADFHVELPVKPSKPAPSPPVAPPASAPPAPPAPVAKPGAARFQLSSQLAGRAVEYAVEWSATDVPLKTSELKFTLPTGVTYVKGSSQADGAPLPDPNLESGVLIYPLGELPVGWMRRLTFKAQIGVTAPAGELTTRATFGGISAGDVPAVSQAAETKVKVVVQPGGVPAKIVIRPHFPTLGVELAAEDKKQLDEMADLIAAADPDQLVIGGHTDNVGIARRNRHIFADNQALSEARARSVGKYLIEILKLPEAKLSYKGFGPSRPVASNKDEAGKARNRRVEVELIGVKPGAAIAIVEQVIDRSDVVELATVGAAPKPAPRPAAPEGPRSFALAAGSKDGFVSPVDGDFLVTRANGVQLSLAGYLSHELSVDGVKVDPKRIGYTHADPVTGKALYSYVGVDVGERGQHVLRLVAKDPMGNVRVDQTIKVTRTGEVASIHFVSADGNVADGRTPVKVRVELRDDAGQPLRAATKLQVRDGNLGVQRPVGENVKLDERTEAATVAVDKDGWVSLAPVATSGAYQVVLGLDKASVKIETYVEPEMRRWILVGIAEGTVGYSKVTGNAQPLKASDVTAEDYYDRGRVAFYAKGRVQGKWLLTMAYDSAKKRRDTDQNLFQVIDPDAFYTLYGDGSQQAYDAASVRKVYVKLERSQYYALFGDYDTGLTVTELGRYGRRMNGVKTELSTRHVEVNAFGSEFQSRFTRDELPGDGTSGLYRLSKQDVSFNTETVTIETRDRFRSERVLQTRALERFMDYSIDYQAGTLFFKEPIAFRDEQLNPIVIVVQYETLASGARDFTYGGRAGLKLFDRRLKLGGTYVHEGQGASDGDLLAGDIRLDLSRGTTLSAELATSKVEAGTASTEGQAYLAEVAHTSKALDARLAFRQQDVGFGLGQQMSSEGGTRKLGLDGTYRIREHLGVIGRAYHQEFQVTDIESDVADARLDYKTEKTGAYVGVRVASDLQASGARSSSDQVFVGGSLRLLKQKLALTAEHAQSVVSNENAAFPTRSMVGADYKISEKLALMASQELTWGAGADTSHTRIGLRTTPWKGASVVNSVDGQFNENALRVFGNTGIRQSFDLSSAWRIDAGVERTQTIAGSSFYTPNPAVAPASGASEDFTAAFGGLSYRQRSFVWESRAEARIAGNEDKWGFLTGVVAELGSGWAWSGRGQYYESWMTGGHESSRANLRLGLVYRPASTDWIFLDRLDLISEQIAGAPTSSTGVSGDKDAVKVVENLNASWRPIKEFQLSLSAGVKYVRETIDGVPMGEVTQRLAVEPRYDVGARFDVGLAASVLHAYRANTVAFGVAPSVGYNVTQNAWISLGWNLFGQDDADFSGSGYVAQGPFLRLRVKFDQDSVKQAAGWLNLQ